MPPSKYRGRLKAAVLLGKYGHIVSIPRRKRKSWQTVCADEFLTGNACYDWFTAMFIAIQQNDTCMSSHTALDAMCSLQLIHSASPSSTRKQTSGIWRLAQARFTH